jgi:hypothetical protein
VAQCAAASRRRLHTRHLWFQLCCFQVTAGGWRLQITCRRVWHTPFGYTSPCPCSLLPAIITDVGLPAGHLVAQPRRPGRWHRLARLRMSGRGGAGGRPPAQVAEAPSAAAAGRAWPAATLVSSLAVREPAVMMALVWPCCDGLVVEAGIGRGWTWRDSAVAGSTGGATAGPCMKGVY